MAKVIKRAALAVDPITELRDTLDSLPLVDNGSSVRFRHRPDQNWTQGKVIGENKDGSLTIIDVDGRSRCIMPANVEVQVTGPKGGKKWLPSNAKAS